MSSQKITTKMLKSLKPKDRTYRVFDSEIKGFFVRVQPSGSISFAFSYRNEQGKSKEYTIGRFSEGVTEKIARDEAKKLAGKIVTQHDPQADKKHARTKGEKDTNFINFIENVYHPRIKGWKSEKETIRVLKTDFSFLHKKKISEITSDDIESWHNKAKNKLAAATVDRRIATLKALFSFALEKKYISVNPASKIKKLQKTDSDINRYLSKDEEQRLRKALDARQERQRSQRKANNERKIAKGENPLPAFENIFTDHLKPMVILAMNTGMRRNEIFQLRINHIDFIAKTVRVDRTIAKSQKTRNIPLNDEALETLSTWVNETKPKDLVFPSPVNGEAFENITKSWNKLIKDAEIENFRFHDLRHHFASKLAMKGAPLLTVSKLLGHASIEQTMRYAHLSDKHKEQIVNLLNI